MLGTVIPPLLPTVFVVSVGISADRLRKNRITCTYPEGILVAGKVNMAFFDKTGYVSVCEEVVHFAFVLISVLSPPRGHITER